MADGRDWYLVHGFNRDKGLFSGLISDMKGLGLRAYDVDYGRTLTLSTSRAVNAIIKSVPNGCNIIAHSNGGVASIAAAMEHGLWIRRLIMVNPPLARDINIPPCIGDCWCVFNRGDKIVSWSKRYNVVINVVMAWRRCEQKYHGDMGRTGPVEWSRIKSVEVSATLGHSGVFESADTRAVIVGLLK